MITMGQLYVAISTLPTKSKSGPQSTFVRHGAVLLFNISRCLSSFRYAGIFSFSVEFAIALGLMAYFLLFTTYASVIKDWAKLHHFVMQAELQEKLNRALNGLIIILFIFLLLCGLGL